MDDSIDPRSKRKWILISVIVVFVCYCAAAYFQELLFRIEGFSFGLFLTLLEFIINSALAFCLLRLEHRIAWLGPSRAVGGDYGRYRNGYSDEERRKRTDTRDTQEEGTEDLLALPDMGSSSMTNRFNGGLVNSLRNSWISRNNRTPMYSYIFLALCAVVSMSFSNCSLQYVSYPTKIVIKSSKVILIMLVGIFIISKRYSLFEYLLAFSTMAGLILFTLGDMSISSSLTSFGVQTGTGVTLLLGSISFEALQVNIQKRLFQDQQSSPAEMTFFISIFGSVFLYLGMFVINSEMLRAVTFMALHPECYLYAFLFCLFGYGGMIGVLYMLHYTDPMFVGLIVTSRKALTLVFSFLLFPKPLTFQHVFGSLLVFGSLFLHVYFSQSTASGGSNSGSKTIGDVSDLTIRGGQKEEEEEEDDEDNRLRHKMNGVVGGEIGVGDSWACKNMPIVRAGGMDRGSADTLLGTRSFPDV